MTTVNSRLGNSQIHFSPLTWFVSTGLCNVSECVSPLDTRVFLQPNGVGLVLQHEKCHGNTKHNNHFFYSDKVHCVRFLGKITCQQLT